MSLFWTLVFSTVCVFADVSTQWESRLEKTPSNLLLRERLGEVYFAKKKYKEVIKTLAPYSNEVSSNALRILAESYGKENDTLNEIRSLEMYKNKEPNLFRPHYLLGIAYKKSKKYDDAVINLRKSIQFAPKHRPSYDELLEVFRETKLDYESRILVNDMINTFGKKKEFFTILCELQLQGGFLADAHKICKEAVRLDPRQPANHIHYAQSFVYLDNKQGAEKVFITAARQFPKDEYVQWATGEYYYQEKNYPIAIRYLKQAVAADKKSARSQLALALSLFETKAYEDALPHYIAACENEDKTKFAQEALRTAASKLRQDGNDKSKDYDKGLVKCL